MSYQVLYRRFRPQKFSEIYGQEQVTNILKNQIETGNISHAYLFSGPKGTGKTSAAKVFAKAINCDDPKGGEPCGVCENCTSQTGASVLNTVEIDAASNRGIDEIRQLKDNISFIPASGKYKVYIIDEVHMLTTEAFNALLKTLEEPPEHVVFIFATTEIYKVLPTIRSRCQRFDFKRISDDIIEDKLKSILSAINIAYDEKALDVIAASSDGSLRDALSLTDKIISVLETDKLTLQDAERVLGLSDESSVFKLAQAITEENAAEALEALDDMIKNGADTEYIVSSLIDYFRSLMIYVSTPKYERLLHKSESYFESLKRSSANVSTQMLTGYITALSRIKSDSRVLPNMRVLLEACILTLCDKDRFTETFTLSARIDKLESRIEALIKQAPARTLVQMQKDDFTPRENVSDETFTEETPPATQPNEPDGAEDKAALAKIRDEIKFAAKYIFNSERDIMLSGIFEDMQPKSFDGHTLYVCPTKSSVFLMDAFESKEGSKKLEDLLSKQMDTPITVKITKPDKQREQKKTDMIDTAKEILGELTELPE